MNIQRKFTTALVFVAVIGFLMLLAGAASSEGEESLPNNHPERNPGGKAATFSTQGSVNLTGEYFQA